MNTIDILVITAVSISAVIGVWRGAVKEIITLLSWGMSGYLAYNFKDAAADFFTTIQSPQFRLIAGFALVLVLALMLGALASKILNKIIGAIGLGGLDKILGFVFGVIRGGVVSLVGLVISTPFKVFPEAMWKASIFATQFEPSITWIKSNFF